jgi:hypothetical protein
MDTEQIMKLSLTLAGLRRTPEDSAIYVKGNNITRILFGIDATVPELLLASGRYGLVGLPSGLYASRSADG